MPKIIEILNAGEVVNTIISDETNAEEQFPGAWRVAAVQPEAATVIPDKHITKLAFISRFTDSEAVAIDLASIGTTVQAAGMRRYMSKVNAATFVDLSHSDTRNGVQALESAGLLAAGRALAILDTPISDVERPA